MNESRWLFPLLAKSVNGLTTSNSPPILLDGTIHQAGFIIEDAQPDNLSAQPIDVLPRIVLTSSNKPMPIFPRTTPSITTSAWLTL